jgi:hypothetical protein
MQAQLVASSGTPFPHIPFKPIAVPALRSQHDLGRAVDAAWKELALGSDAMFVAVARGGVTDEEAGLGAVSFTAPAG